MLTHSWECQGIPPNLPHPCPAPNHKPHTKLPRDKPHQCQVHSCHPLPTHSSSSAPSPCSRVSADARSEDFRAMMLSVQDAPVFPSPAKLHLVTVPASSLANESERRKEVEWPLSLWWKHSGDWLILLGSPRPGCGPQRGPGWDPKTPDRSGHPQEPQDWVAPQDPENPGYWPWDLGINLKGSCSHRGQISPAPMKSKQEGETWKEAQSHCRPHGNIRPPRATLLTQKGAVASSFQPYPSPQLQLQRLHL